MHRVQTRKNTTTAPVCVHHVANKNVFSRRWNVNFTFSCLLQTSLAARQQLRTYATPVRSKQQGTFLNITPPKACSKSKVAGQPPLYGNVSQLVRNWGHLIEICSRSWQLRGNFAFAGTSSIIWCCLVTHELRRELVLLLCVAGERSCCWAD